MANLTQSCKQTQTLAPDYYNNYLTGLATQGLGAAQNAQFVGATPLQQQAYGSVAGVADAYKPGLQQASCVLHSATGMAENNSPLTAASPYLQHATSCLGARTSGLMNPYVKCVVNQINTLGQQNIQQNLAPSATAGAVGSGQFGSQRGEQVLGQTIANANQQILSQQANALMCGYKTALCGAVRQGAICNQAGATAGCLASHGVNNLESLAKARACLASMRQSLGIKGLCSMATLGEQQRTIAQNQQLFPLSTLCKASNLLRNYQIPTTTRCTSTVSPLGAAAGIGTLLAGSAPGGGTVAGALAQGAGALYHGIKCYFGNPDSPSGAPIGCTPSGCVGCIGCTGAAGTVGCPGNYIASGCTPSWNTGCVGCIGCTGAAGTAGCPTLYSARGGLVHVPTGCRSTQHRGALPRR